MTPEKASALLEAAARNPDMVQRTMECVRVIKALCAAGYAEEAWGMIDDRPGQVRNSELAAFFATSGYDTAALMQKLDGLIYKDDAPKALEGYFSSLSPEEIRKVLGDDVFRRGMVGVEEFSPGSLKRAIADGLMSRVAFNADSSDSEAAVALASDLHSKGVVDDNGLSQVLESDKSKDIFQKWSVLSKAMPATSIKAPGGPADQVRREMIGEMVSANAPEALHQISGIKSDQGTVDLGVAIMKWGAMDSVAANEWYVANKAGLSNSQRDGVAAAFWSLAVRYKERASAEQWAKEIQNPKLREKALASLPPAPKKD
jgi:hypothetical protein